MVTETNKVITLDDIDLREAILEFLQNRKIDTTECFIRYEDFEIDTHKPEGLMSFSDDGVDYPVN